MRVGAFALIYFLLSVVMMFSISCGGGGNSDPVVPTPPAIWTSPVHPEFVKFPDDYVAGREYKLIVMQSVGDAFSAGPNDLVIGLYTQNLALYPYNSSLRMESKGDLYVRDDGGFMATTTGQKNFKVEVIDAQGNLYAVLQFYPYFQSGNSWDSPVGRFHIEAEPNQYIVGQFYDLELVANMGDLMARQPNQVMVGLYLKATEGGIYSQVIGLKFLPSGNSIYINEFGGFTASCAGEKTIVAEVVDAQGHLYISVVFHPTFVASGTPPPTCQELHPDGKQPSSITNTYWDCIDPDGDGVYTWGDTGEPVNPPPPVTYNLHIYGAQGEFSEGGTINIDEGNGYQLQVWELAGSDGSKIALDGSTATMESSILPFWCWDSAGQEIMTVLWASPDYPDPLEPGNIFINPGMYDLKLTITHAGKQYCRIGTVKVLDRPDFP